MSAASSSSAEPTHPAAVIFGCAGETLGAEERRFFADADPLGFILFGRNCREPRQVRDLVSALRDTVGRDDAPVLIDQEGGRVQRLGPLHWRRRDAWRGFGDMAAERGLDRAIEAARVAARDIAGELADLGIDVNCLPLLDVPAPRGHAVIGDRAFSSDPDIVAALGRAVCEGLLSEGVVPVIKHIPGHGRATVDSHLALPAVDAPAEALEADFAPFRALRDMPWAMTAHVVYTAFDADAPATASRTVVERAIRGSIGFEGLLVSDDLCMKALTGGFGARARAALDAGCDVVLHCNGDLDEMRETMHGTGRMSDRAMARFRNGVALARRARLPVTAGD